MVGPGSERILCALRPLAAAAAALALALLAGCVGGRDYEPAPVRSVPASGAVTVQRGDTVYAISRRYDLPVREVIAANRLRPPFIIKVGDVLKLPVARRHMVGRGDTVYNISRRYGVQQSELVRLNQIAPPYTIKLGQVLTVPPPAPPPTPAPAQSQPQARPSSKGLALAEPPPRAGRGFLWPVKGRVVSRFGAKQGGLHNDGINIAASRGTEIRAAENGVVAYAGNELRGFGNLLLIKHAGGWMTAYAHNDRLLVGRGERVRRGQVVARLGSSGSVATPQLHFEIRRGTKAVNPSPLLTAAASGAALAAKR